MHAPPSPWDTFLQVAGPQGQVVTQQLHNQRAVLVRFLGEGVQFGDGIVERLLGQVASSVGAPQNFIVEHGKVQGQSQADGVRGSQLRLSHVGRLLVSIMRGFGGGFTLVTGGELGQVTVVVTLHLAVKHFGLSRLGSGKEMVVQHLQNVLANVGQLILDLGAVSLDLLDMGSVSLGLLLLLDGGDDAPASTASTDYVLVRNGEEVALFDG